MPRKGFTKSDFQTFKIKGLEQRMEAIQERIQPKFNLLGQELADELTKMTGTDMHLHIAKHARRTVNPPNDTWLAIAANKRGYKQHPHFQLGLFDDHLFIWLAYIYELPNKAEIAEQFLKHQKDITSNVPGDYVVSLDHTQKEATALKDISLQNVLERFRDVKKAEFLIGRQIAANDPVVRNGEKLVHITLETYRTLLPLYQLSMREAIKQ